MVTLIGAAVSVGVAFRCDRRRISDNCLTPLTCAIQPFLTFN